MVWYKLTKSSRSAGEPVTRVDVRRSALNASMSIDLDFLKETSFLVGLGLLILRGQDTMQWSEMKGPGHGFSSKT